MLWLVKVSGVLAGYIWTIRGATINPDVRTLTHDEVSFFDNMIFENFRGRGINPILINYVLSEMQKQKCVRAFIGTKVTNVSEIKSLEKNGFSQMWNRLFNYRFPHFSWPVHHLDAYNHVEIGEDYLIAPYCFIKDTNHTFDEIDIPIRLQKLKPEKVIIGDDVWLGTRVCVLPGVTIGQGCVIGAGAVGTPAKVIKKRGASPNMSSMKEPNECDKISIV